MENKRITARDVLSKTISFPSDEAQAHLSHLVGLDGHIEALTRDLRLIFDPQMVEAWSNRHYGSLLPAVELIKDAVPLIVFEGDVGTGKTALAEAIGQRVAVDGNYGVHLVKMSTRVWGTGYVGEMGTLLAESFKHIEGIWNKRGELIIFVIDEADSLLTTRASEQHHHEDKSGVNTILQHLDEFRKSTAQIGVIAITNRVGILDPAVRRRATSVFKFERPNESQRRELLQRLFNGALSDDDVELLVEASNPKDGDSNEEVPLTYSDLTLRFAIPAIREAVWHGNKLDIQSLAKALRRLAPAPRMSGVES